MFPTQLFLQFLISSAQLLILPLAFLFRTDFALKTRNRNKMGNHRYQFNLQTSTPGFLLSPSPLTNCLCTLSWWLLPATSVSPAALSASRTMLEHSHFGYVPAQQLRGWLKRWEER